MTICEKEFYDQIFKEIGKTLPIAEAKVRAEKEISYKQLVEQEKIRQRAEEKSKEQLAKAKLILEEQHLAVEPYAAGLSEEGTIEAAEQFSSPAPEAAASAEQVSSPSHEIEPTENGANLTPDIEKG